MACAVIAARRPRPSCWSTARRSPISGGSRSRTCSGSSRDSSAADGGSSRDQSTWPLSRRWPDATTSPSCSAATARSSSTSAITSLLPRSSPPSAPSPRAAGSGSPPRLTAATDSTTSSRFQLGPVRHTFEHADPDTLEGSSHRPAHAGPPGPPDELPHMSEPVDLSVPGAIAARPSSARRRRLPQRTDPRPTSSKRLTRGRHCLVLAQRTAHVDHLADKLTERGLAPVVLKGGMGARARKAALARLAQDAESSPLLVVATGHFVGEGFDCPALDTLFLAGPVSFKGRLVQYAGRVLAPIRASRPPRCTTTTTSRPVLAAALRNALPATSASASPTRERADELHLPVRGRLALGPAATSGSMPKRLHPSAVARCGV